MTDALKQATAWPGADLRAHGMRRHVTSRGRVRADRLGGGPVTGG